MEIVLKVWSDFFKKIESGEKGFEARLADFDCNPGDILVLKEWDKDTRSFTGREMVKTVTYVFRTKDQKFWRQEDVDKYGLQVISFK